MYFSIWGRACAQRASRGKLLWLKEYARVFLYYYPPIQKQNYPGTCLLPASQVLRLPHPVFALREEDLKNFDRRLTKRWLV
jgi:hypothetical protein